MVVLTRKERGIIKPDIITKLFTISFLTSISSALVSTIWAVYLYSFIHSQVWVGFFSAFLTIISFVSYFFFIPLIQKTGKSKLFSYSLLLFFITYIALAFNTNFFLFLFLAIAITLIFTLRITSFGIIVKDKSKKNNLSKNEGLIYSFTNLAYVIGPIIAGYLANKYGFSIVFLISAISILLGLIIFKISGIKDVNIDKKPINNIKKNFFDFFKNKTRVIAYILGGGINFWWSFIYLFIPLHIIRSGLNDIWVGYFLFAIAMPLILTEYHFSKVAGKIGFKKIFKKGFLIVAIISLICFFISNIYLTLGLLVIASFGIAMLEPTTEAYFLDILKNKKEENRFYGPYNTTIDLGSFISKVIASVILIFLPFKFLFLFFGFSMFIFFLISFKTKTIIEDK
ncbi:MFS transporter [Candidatus Pacearchaeota archaeon]|nr:MFS transporter [Candidatus Pacearchaeota archaeon]